jgi:hypothetical protein
MDGSFFSFFFEKNVSKFLLNINTTGMLQLLVEAFQVLSYKNIICTIIHIPTYYYISHAPFIYSGSS